MSTAQITVPLDIPDIRVLQTQITRQGEFIITVESTLSSARCHRRGREIRQFHGLDDWVMVRHLPILGRPVYLRYRPKRYRCDGCDNHPTTTQQLAWHTPNSSITTGAHNVRQLSMVFICSAPLAMPVSPASRPIMDLQHPRDRSLNSYQLMPA